MEIQDSVHKSEGNGKQNDAVREPEARVHERQQRGSARGLQLLAALLLVVCLTGGTFIYGRLRQGTQAVSSPQAKYNWCTIPTARINSQTGQSGINKVVTISANDAWAIGGIDTGDYTKNAERVSLFMEHWDGANWQIVPTADTTPLLASMKSQIKGDVNEEAHLIDLSVVASNDIWAIGSVGVWQANLGATPMPKASTTLIEHWDGKTWQLAESPALVNDVLTSVLAISSKDVWAVGGNMTDMAHYTPLIEHWNGSIWQTVTLPAQLPQGSLTKIQATSTNDIWVFGISSALQGAPSIALHWNGQKWSSANFPDHVLSNLYDEAVISPRDIWTVGAMHQGSLPLSFAIQHWDGHRWSQIAGARDVNKSSQLFRIFANRANDIWITGNTTGNKPLLEHWNGQNWSAIQPEQPAFGVVSDLAFAGSKVWVLTDIYKNSNGYPPTGSLLEASC